MGKSRWVPALVAIVGTAILWVLYHFNKEHYVGHEYYVVNFTALFWLPMLLILLVVRQEPTSFGFSTGDAKKGYKLAGVFFLALFPALVFVARTEGYQAYYPIDRSALIGIGPLIRHELFYGAYLFCWEFFFRGFLLFGLHRAIGWWSVPAQAIPFGLMHLGKPEFAWSFLGGIALGYLALRSKSFLPAFVLHWAVSIAIDALVIMSARGYY